MFTNSKSVRTELLAIFIGVMLLIVAAILLLNILFVDDFYLEYNKNQFSNAIDEVYESGELSNKTIEHICGGHGSIYDFYSLKTHAMPDRIFALSKEDVMNLRDNAIQTGEAAYVIPLANSSSEDTKIIIFGKIIENSLVVAVKPMELAEEVKDIFAQFLLIISVVIFLVSIPLVMMLSNQISKPLVELSRTTERIAKLQFSDNLQSTRNDEIGILQKNVGIMSDRLSETISTLNDTNAKLNTELNKERSMMKMRRRFVSDVSHELKNPIAMIIAYADGLNNGIAKTYEDRAYYLNVILEEGDKMTLILKDLLELSTYQSGTFALEREEFEVKNLVSDIVERQRKLHNDSGIELQVNTENVSTYYGDRLRIGEILNNFLDNAYKNTTDEGQISITAQSDNGTLVLTVKNNGELISENELENIFDSFYKLKTDGSGSGLGLAIVKSIAELHGGTARAYTTETQNCFEVVLPHQ